jgi:hypothetical protein
LCDFNGFTQRQWPVGEFFLCGADVAIPYLMRYSLHSATGCAHWLSLEASLEARQSAKRMVKCRGERHSTVEVKLQQSLTNRHRQEGLYFLIYSLPLAVGE